MIADHIENPRLLKAVQKLNIKHDANCALWQENLCATLNVIDTIPANYPAVRLCCGMLSDLLIIDDGKKIHYRVDRNGVLQKVSLHGVLATLSSHGLIQ